jgi:hypothetical protein
VDKLLLFFSPQDTLFAKLASSSEFSHAQSENNCIPKNTVERVNEWGKKSLATLSSALVF